MESEAVRLFVERAMAVRPDFSADARERHARRRDRAPARRPAAGDRARRRPDPAPLARPRWRSALATGWACCRRAGATCRSASGRCAARSTGATTCSTPRTRRLFARLGVFAGGGPIETAEAVCGIAGDDRAARRVRRPRAPRGAEPPAHRRRPPRRRAVHDARDDPRVRAGQARGAGRDGRPARPPRGGVPGVRGGDRTATALDTTAAAAAHARLLDRLEDEHDNLRAALEHLTTTGDTGARGGPRVRAVAVLAHARPHHRRARRASTACSRCRNWTDEPTRARLRALEAAGGLAYWGGDLVSAGTHYRAAVEVARALGDDARARERRCTTCSSRDGRPATPAEWIDVMRGDDTALLDEALEIWTRLGDEQGMGKALWGLSEWYGYRERLRAGRGRRRPGRSRSSNGSATRSGSAGRGSRARSGGCWPATCRAPRATSGRRCASSGRAATFPASRSSCRPSRRLLLLVDRRESTATRWAAPRAASSPRRACTSRPLAERRRSRSSTPTPRIPSSAPPLARGAHGRATRPWSARSAYAAEIAQEASDGLLSGVRWRACTPRIAQPDRPRQVAFVPLRLIDDERGDRSSRRTWRPTIPLS